MIWRMNLSRPLISKSSQIMKNQEHSRKIPKLCRIFQEPHLSRGRATPNTISATRTQLGRSYYFQNSTEYPYQGCYTKS